MGACVFLGEEAAGAGWRLAGVEPLVPTDGGEDQALAEALGRASLVLVSAEVAARIPEPVLRAALRRLDPVTLVVPDLRGRVSAPDITARLKRQLGIES